MAGDAALGITPVMKWNFERSCYRWLVTRHPAQFERMDFTAQILQSASRARKAFYECGWAEAKVLIRPSDGKFERTPLFDTIIRRGLRNSTRFDASTLTEEEIEALGMHRDETLGYKLQIRQFRSNARKELPPIGRGGGVSGRQRASTSSGAASAVESGSVVRCGAGAIATAGAVSVCAGNGAVAGASRALSAVRARPVVENDGGSGARGRDARLPPDQASLRGRSSDSWGGEGGRVPASGRDWTNEARWHSGHRTTEALGVRRDGWAPGESTGRWDFRGGVPAPIGERECHSNSREDTRYPDNGMAAPMVMPPWAHHPLVTPANREGHQGSQGPPSAIGWGCSVGGNGNERHYRPPMRILGGAVSEETCRSGPREGDDRDCRVRPEGPGGLPGRQSEAEVRASLRRQVEHLARRPSGLGGGEARDSPQPADGGLITQGYRRLAAMNFNGDGGDDAPRRTMVEISTAPRRSSPGPRYDAQEPHGGDRVRQPAETRPLGPYEEAGSGRYPPEVDEGRAQKRRRSGDRADGNGSAIGGGVSQSPGASAERSHDDSDVKDSQTWPRGRGASTPPEPECDLLARELAESEKQLSQARHALDVAQARFEETNRAHQAKREQVIAAAGKRAAEAAHTLEECASLNSFARSSDGTSNSGGDDRSDGRDDRREPPAVRRSQDRVAASPDRRRASSSSPTAGSAVSPRDCTDEMREVKREAALLYGIGRALISPEDSPPASAPASAIPSPDVEYRVGSPEGNNSGPITNPPRSGLSRNGCAPASTSEELSARAQRSSPPSPSSHLPKLVWAIPNGVCGVRGGRGGAAAEEGCQQYPSRDVAPMGRDGRRVGVRLGSPADRSGIHAGGFPAPVQAVRPSEVATGAAFTHRSATTRDALPSISQTPGSPSASGETDSDHSDSTSGAGATQDDARSQQQHQKMYEVQRHKRDAAQMSGFRQVSDEGGKQRWGGRSRGVEGTPEGNIQGGRGYVAPLATAGAR